MKKIVAAAVAALMLAGAAFADVSFSYQETGIVSGNQGKALSKVNRTDCLALEVSSDICGVVMDWDIEGDTSTDNKLTLDSYYGWLTYGLPAGNLQITSGKWTARYVNRVKADAGSLDSAYYEVFKPGVINGDVASDSDNLTDNKMATVLAYTLAEKLPGTLMVKAGAVSGAYDKYDSQSYFVGEVCWNQKDLINANLAFKSFASDKYSVGAFVSPLMVEKLTSMVGFSYGSAKEADETKSEFGLDARARYVLSDKTAVTGMFNYSKTGFSKGKDGEDLASMWTMASVNYVAGDNIRFIATVNHCITDFTATQGATLTSFSPVCEVKASKAVTVTAGANFAWEGAPYSGAATLSLPIYVNVAL